jgi:hypothetical protein
VLSLVILGPATPHAGKGVAKSAATEAVTEALIRCRASQRRFRNTLLFVAADETQLGTAREAMRRALAWESIGGDARQDKRVDKRLQDQLTQAQLADARDKAKNSRDGAVTAVRTAWSHVLFPVKTEATEVGTPFDLAHLSLLSKDRASVPAAAYEKASTKGDGIIKEAIGAQTFSSLLTPLWPDDKPHLAVSELTEWFAAYVYLPKLRDGVVLETAIRDACAKLDPPFAYADRFDEAAGRYIGLLWQKAPSEPMAPSAVLVRSNVAIAQLRPAVSTPEPGSTSISGGFPSTGVDSPTLTTPVASLKTQPRRFFGSVEIDSARPVKAVEAIVNAVVLELQRVQGVKVKLTLEIEAEAPVGFAEGDISVVRDNARQLKFKAESTGFED